MSKLRGSNDVAQSRVADLREGRCSATRDPSRMNRWMPRLCLSPQTLGDPYSLGHARAAWPRHPDSAISHVSIPQSPRDAARCALFLRVPASRLLRSVGPFHVEHPSRGRASSDPNCLGVGRLENFACGFRGNDIGSTMCDKVIQPSESLAGGAFHGGKPHVQADPQVG